MSTKTATSGPRSVETIDESMGLVACRQCGRRWIVLVRSGTRRQPNGWWKCLSGCNHYDIRHLGCSSNRIAKGSPVIAPGTFFVVPAACALTGTSGRLYLTAS